MKFKTFILTFLMMMSCSISFGQGSLTGSATTEAQLWMHLNDDEIGTISLANDIKITATCPIPNGKKVTIDLNGHKLFTEEEIYIINNEGKLTITDNSEGKTGTISSTLGIYNGVTPTRTSVTDVKYDRVLTINGGVFNSSSKNGNAATIYNYRGVIKINGGEFYGEHSAITNYGMATIANAYIECLNRDNGAAAIINDYEITYGENVNIVGIYTTVTGTAYTTGTEPTYLFAELKNGPKYPSLQAALDACTTGDNTINLLFHNSDNATVSQKEGVNITIDGNGYKDKQFEYSGTITVDGKSAAYATAGLTIEDVKFNANNITKDASINLGGNNSIRYTSNVTVKNCTFEGVDKAKVAIKNYTGGCKNLVVKNCEATGLHSLVQVKGIAGVTVENVKVTDCKNGISVGTSDDVAIKGADIEAEGYGLRADGSGEYSLNVENSTLSAEVPVIVRETTGEYDLTVAADVTLTATNGGPQVVVTKDSDDDPYVAPTVKVNVTLNNGASTFGLVAKIGNKYYSTLDEAFAVATEGQTITLLGDATPDLTSQSAITKAAVIDLGGKTLTLTEDDLYFGTTTFQNGNIVVDPSVKASTAVFWMFENQTLTFDNVNITATGVTGTYLIGINGGTGSNVNLLNGTNIIINNASQAALSAVICDNGTGNNVIIEDSYINVNNIEGRFYLGGTSGNITVDNTNIDLDGVKEGFYLRANQTLSIEGESEVEVVLNDTNNRYGINITDYSATYTKDDSATVNATVYDPVVRVKNLTELQTALVENVDKPIFATETIVISEGTLELDLNTRRVFAADKNVIKNDGATLTIKNGTIERVGDVIGYAFNNAQGALNITGTTIKGGLYTSGTSLVATNANISHFQSERHAIYAYNCNVTLNGGTYHNDNSGNATIMAAGSSVVTIKDGTFSIKDGRQELGWTSCLTDTKDTASITVEGGTFNGGFRVQTGATMTIEGGSFNDCYGSSYNIYGTAVVKGGTFTDANAINFAKGNLAEGYVASDNGNGTFTVLKGVAKIGDTYYATLQEAINAVQDGETITLLSDITENVTLTEKVGLYYTINGSDKTMNGSITVNPLSDTNDNRRITISNINFVENTDTDVDFISAVKTNHYPRLTISGCYFTGSGNVGAVVAVRLKSSRSVVIENCTGTGLHSFLQNTAGWNLTIDNVKVNNAAEGGFALGTVQGVTVKNCEINSGRYGIRLDGQYNNNAVIESNKINAFIPVVVRKASVDGTITFNGTNEFTQSNTDGYWCVIGTTEYEENGEMPTAPTASVSVTLNDTGLERKGIYGSALNGEGTVDNPYLIETVNDLVFFRDRVNGGNNYAGKHVKLAADIDLSSIENWTPIGDITYNNKYQPADNDKVFSGVFNGNDKVISNLKINRTVGGADTQANVGLFGITGEGAVIKDLTLTNVNIETDGRNVGALAGFAYKATLDNITVNGNIQIKGGNNVSGVAGMTRHYAMSATNIKVIGNDASTIVGNNIVGGIFAEIAPNGSAQTFESLSVENVAITGASGVGGIVGLLTTGAVDNVSVKNVVLTGRTDYKIDDLIYPMGRIRLGSVSGLMGGQYATIANVTTENVTAKNLEGTEIEDLPIIGANYDSASNATEARIGDTYYATLKKAIDAVKEGDNTIQLLADITGDVTVTQKEGVDIVIDGKKAENKNYQFNGTIYIEGNSRNTGDETLTIQNVNFYTENPSHDFISANSTDSDKRYAHNVTVKDCNFATSAENTNNAVVGMRFRQAYNITVENCKSDGIFSIMWGTAVEGLALNEVELTNCSEGITIAGASKNVTITKSEIVSPTYGIRASVEGGQFTMTNSTINALVPVVVRNDNGITNLDQYTLSFTFEETNTITESNPTNYWFVAGETEYKGTSEEMPTAPKGNIIVNLNDNGLSYDGVYGNFAVAKIGDVQYLTFEAALNAVNDGETIELFNITGSENKELEFTKDIEFTITGEAPNYALPIITFQNATVNISNAEILIPELDAREDATINVIDSKVYDAGGNSIAKSYFNGAINIYGTSEVYMMQVTTMGYINISGTAKLHATWQTNVYGNGLITLNNGATFATAGLNLIAKYYEGRDNTDEERVGKPAEIVVNGANFTVGKVYSASGADYSYNADGYGINVGTIEGKSAILTIKNGGNVNIYTGNGKTANIGADGTVNIDASTFNVECRAENGTATLANNGTVNVTGEANLAAANVTGNGWFYMNGVALDADTKLLGAKVRFASGTNNIDGSTINDGFFQVGIGAYNGTDANVDTENGVVVNVKNAVVGANGDTYAGWAGTGFYDTDDEKADVMTDAKYVLNIENSIAEFGYLHISNDGELNVNGNATEKACYNNSDYSFYAGEVIINGTATFDATDVLALYTKVSCDNGTDNPGTLNIVNGTEYEAERHNGAVAGLNFDIRKTGIVNVAEGANLHVGEPASIAADATMNIGGTATVLGELTNNGTINFTSETATLTVPTTGLEVNNETGNNDIKVVYESGAYKFIDKHYVAEIVGGAKYESLAEAIEAVAENGTVKLIDHEIFTEDNRTCSSEPWYEGVYYLGDKNFTIDLNGYTVTQNGAVNDYMFLFKNDGTKDNTITLKNGTIDAGTAAFCALATSSSNVNKMTINTEKINFVGNNSGGAVLKIRGGAELNVKAGTKITGENSYVGIEAAGSNTVVNIYEGAEIYQNGESSNWGCLAGASGNSTINVYGGKGTSAKGGFIAMTSGGTINVEGGEWIANTDGTYANDNNAVLIAQSNKQYNAGAGNSIVNVSGGVFKGGYNCYGDAAGDAQINISGGIFSVNPSDYCAENYGAFPYDENSWVVRMVYGTQEFTLTADWNWMSSYISEFDTDGLTWLKEDLSGQVGAQIKNNLHAVTNYEQGWFGSLTNVSVKEMYKVKVTADATFTHEGSYVNYDECEIVLYPGWNYISYPVNEEMNLIDALAKLQPSPDDIIKRQDATATYAFGAWRSAFTLTPGQGYMYKNASDKIKSFYYTTKKTTSTDSNNRSSKYWTVDATQYPSNMTMIAMTDVEGGNYEVAAFVNGELRGSSRPVYVEELNAHILILTISGDEVAEVTFKYYDIATGEEVAFSNRINYSNDAVVGSMAEPYMLTRGTTGIGEASLSEINIYPNPTTTGTEINLQATCDKVEVFNALGVKVAEYQNVDTIDALETAGIYVIRITNNGNVQNCRLVVK